MSNKSMRRVQRFNLVTFKKEYSYGLPPTQKLAHLRTTVGVIAGLTLACYFLNPLFNLSQEVPAIKKWLSPNFAQMSVQASEGVDAIYVDSAVAGQDQQVSAPSVPSEGWEEFVAAVDKVAPIYNFPKNVVLSQGALESARGTSHFAKDRNNYLGIGAFDHDPNLAYSYENAEQCVIQYMLLIRKNFPEAWAQRENPEALLHALKVNSKNNMYATDPNYEAKVKSMKEWN
ncbi:MAG: glucosaminidase domain-containing protein [bacterium]|nr:glucosaminidase domain-containing protein [bacterium]